MPSSKIISSTASTIPITASTISTTSSKNSTTTSVNPTFTTTAQQSAPQVSPPTESSFPLTSVGPAYTGNPSSDVVSTTSSSPSSPSSTLTDATSVRSRKVAKLSLTDANAVVPFIDENKPKDLFPEVLFMIAGMLSLADVKRCVWVNKNWYASCCIHLWQEVGHFQWQNNTFPLLKVANDTNPVWNGHRRRIRKLSWSDDDNTVVDWCRMIGMLRGMPNLKEVTLIGRESAPPQAFLSFLQDSNSFRRVTSLHLEMDNFVQEPLVQGEPIPIKNVIQGVEYLKELHVGGPWFRDENEDELRADATIWNLERLTIPRMYLRLLRRCQRLQVLTLASPLGMGVGTPIAHITACANLEELTFAGLTAFNVDDSEMVVPAMQVLTTLIINHLSQDNHARLHVLVDAANLPSLSKVELARIPGAAGGSLASQILTQSNQAMLVRLLRARQGLRSFTLRGMCIRAHEFFTVNEEGQTTPTCPCPQLEELWQELHTTAYMESTPEVMNRHWTTTYSQIGSMPRLHTLTLKSLGLKVSAEAGFESLNHIETLKRLTLSIPHGHTWTVLELQTIMAGVPKLTSFKLTPIAPLNRKHVNAWLKMHGKRKLRF
ncbi:hypothetical protein BGW39_003118 [Mortierella sp. 14UC]|nr:hypothetical protein BGW39_003118 [Mortierella sp. 14UC]